LDVDGTAGSFEGTGKLYEETVTHGLDLPSAMLPKRLPQQLAVFVQKFESDCLVFLRQRAVSHHVGEHDRRQPSVLLQLFSHQILGARQYVIDIWLGDSDLKKSVSYISKPDQLTPSWTAG
jgi:hypothetical protein